VHQGVGEHSVHVAKNRAPVSMTEISGNRQMLSRATLDSQTVAG
jgi:hypothetical protein